MDKQLLEKRRIMFNAYIKALLKPSVIQENFGLIILLERFLDHASNYERDSQLTGDKKAVVGNVRNSVRSVKTVVTSAPNNLISTVDNVMGGLKGAFNVS